MTNQSYLEVNYYFLRPKFFMKLMGLLIVINTVVSYFQYNETISPIFYKIINPLVTVITILNIILLLYSKSIFWNKRIKKFIRYTYYLTPYYLLLATFIYNFNFYIISIFYISILFGNLLLNKLKYVVIQSLIIICLFCILLYNSGIYLKLSYYFILIAIVIISIINYVFLRKLFKKININKKLVSLFINNSPEIILLIDTNGKIIYANEKALNFFKEDILDNLIGKDIFKIVTFSISEEEKNQFLFNDSWNKEVEIIFETEVYWSQVVVNSVDESNLLVKLINISSTKKAESIYENISSAYNLKNKSVLIANDQYIVEFVNDNFLKLTGFSRESVIGTHVKELLVKPFSAYQIVTNTIREGKIWEGEIDRYKKDGNIIYTLSNIKPFINDENKITHFIEVIEDNTIQKKAEEAINFNLNDKQQKNLVNEVIYIFDKDAHILNVFPRGEEIFFNELQNIDIHEILGDLSDIYPPEVMEKTHNSILKIQSGEKVVLYEYQIQNAEDELIKYFSARMIALDNKYYLSVVKDITDLRNNEKELLNAQKKYYTLFSAANDAILILENNLLIECNDKTLEILGYERKELIFKNFLYLSVEKQDNNLLSKEYFEEIKNKVLNNEPQILNWLFKRKGGEVFIAQISLNSFVIDKKVFIQMILRDISEQKRQEMALEQSKRELKENNIFLNTLIQTIPYPVFFKDIEGHYIDCSEAFCKFMGYSKDQIIGKTTFDIYPYEDALSNDSHDKILLSTKQKQIYEQTLKIQNRGIRNVIIHRDLYYKSDGNIGGIVGMIIDITSLKNSEKALQETNEKYYKLFSKATDAIFIFEEGRFIDCNEKVLQLFNTNKKYLFETIYHISDLFPNQENLLEKIYQGEISDIEYTFPLNQGNTIIGEVSFSLFNIGDIKYLQVFIKDITEKKKINAQLQENERYLRTMMNNLPGMVYRCSYSEKWSMLFVSWGSYNLFGFTPDEVMHNFDWSSLIYVDDRRYVWEEVQKAVNEKRAYQLSFRMYHKSGQLKWVWEHGEAIYNKEGEVIALEGFITDITKEKEFEIELIENQQRYYKLFNEAFDAIVMMQNGQFIDCNEHFLQMFRFEKNEIIGQTIEKLLPQYQSNNDLSFQIINELIEASQKGNPKFSRFEFIKQDRTVFYAEVSISSFNIENDIYVQFIIRDITERMIAEEKIKLSEKNYRNLIESSPTGIIITDVHNIYFVNKSLVNILGFNNEVDLLKYNLLDLFTEKDKIKFIRYIKNIKKEEDDNLNFIELSAKHPITKDIIELEIKAVLFEYNNKKAYQVVLRDVSIQKRLIQAKLKAQLIEESNQKLVNEVNERIKVEEKLTRSLKEKEVLLKEVHHRVKNNMQIISSIINLQSSYLTDERTKQIFKESQDRIKSLALVHENLYRHEDLSDINFKEYIYNLVNNLYRSYSVDSNNIKLNLDIEEIFFNLDVGIPCGLIINELVSNSLKYAFKGREEGNLHVQLFQKRDNIHLIISDDGIGIDKKLDIYNTKSLGLQLVITLVDQIEGKLELIRDNGTKFIIIYKK